MKEDKLHCECGRPKLPKEPLCGPCQGNERADLPDWRDNPDYEAFFHD